MLAYNVIHIIHNNFIFIIPEFQVVEIKWRYPNVEPTIIWWWIVLFEWNTYVYLGIWWASEILGMPFSTVCRICETQTESYMCAAIFELFILFTFVIAMKYVNHFYKLHSTSLKSDRQINFTR